MKTYRHQPMFSLILPPDLREWVELEAVRMSSPLSHVIRTCLREVRANREAQAHRLKIAEAKRAARAASAPTPAAPSSPPPVVEPAPKPEPWD